MSESPDVEAVFWDIGGVILRMESVRAAHREFVERLCSEYPAAIGSDAALERWRTVLGAYFGERDGTEFRPAREGYQLAVDEILTVDPEETEWESLFQRIRNEQVEPNPDAIAAIEVLAAAPLHQGVISDVDDGEGEQLLRTFGVWDAMDSYTASETVGRTKPDPAMFETALEKAGVTPERAVMIGDRYEHDMDGGTQAGLWTVAYGAEDGPAVDIALDDLRELPDWLALSDGE
ncbi:HAD family hydrolase [Haloarcula sp. CBA1130]|uniref:HAD family hydrolase n=1 Tax=unclassified Haloarcula TaxID=2624677 RepID=UPI0012473DDE|nr:MULTISPECIES: HAD family hydrolase [unclassified Haloarcula]KAA9396713.1 HAD family hydrolase [Haloarcula sp. CBA1129]KAA9401674.1 HAD family hydrolase [Haloarcula sp. CBA1130]